MTITLISASIMIIWLAVLTINVGKYRVKTKTSLGDSGDHNLLRAIRAHGNFTEFTPLCLLMLGLLEYSRANTILVLGLGIAIVLGRILHGLGLGFPTLFEKDTNKFRLIGTLLTLISLFVSGIAGLLIAYRFV